MACSYFQERLSRDTEKSLANHKQELLDAELRRWHENALGQPGQGPSEYRYFTMPHRKR
jgi:hypothetical protein